MARVFVSGSTTGLGRAAAEALLDDGHEVVVHARNRARAAELTALGVGRGAQLVIGDLASREETQQVADQVNAIGDVDTVIHNAAIYVDDRRVATPEGHARTLAVNVIAPYLLTAWINSPSRLVYLSSGMHRSGDTSLRDIDWVNRRWSGVQAYCDSKLYVAALAFALARRRPSITAHAVDPGWVPTRMGGPGAPDDLELGHQTQVWLAVTHDADANTPGYWHHQQREQPATAALDKAFQDALVGELARLTEVEIPEDAAY
jgi:NAD(P)-dependent dehydrogenase (short-subunit alcohol dehydrogenase family)